ncbi:formimidoylglutamate deiminase [Actibacterium sp. D379-3]
MQALWSKTALLPEGWRENVRIELDPTGHIGAVRSDTPRRGDEAESLAIMLPAAVNLHSHAFQRAMAGLAEARGPQGRDSFWTWRQLMYRFLDVLLPEDVEAITAFAQMEMLEAGFAAVCEFHYLHHRAGGAAYDDSGELSARIAAAAARSGIGLTLLPVLYQQGGCDGRALEGGQRRFGNTRDSFARVVERAEAAVAALPGDSHVGLAPHSLRAVPPEAIVELRRMRPDRPFHMHLAEQAAEVKEVETAHGTRPVSLVLDRFGPDANWCLIHCTQMTAAETRALAASGAVAGLCPITEASLGDGVFDAVRFADAGGTLGVGTDSNIRISLAGELRALEYGQRLRDKGRAVLAGPGRSTGRWLYDAALRGGALAAGRQSGMIAAGARADLLALDGGAVDLLARRGDAILDAFVFARGDAIRDVWSAGRHVVRDGRHVDRPRLTLAYRDRLQRVMGAL